jgi:hypothetical protein
MIVATLTREKTGDSGTFGTLRIGGLTLATGELPYRGNATGISSIPAGDYWCKRITSPKFGHVYEITNVPGRSHVLIHAGNFCGDKALGLKSDVEGCCVLGQRIGKIEGQDAVTSSDAAMRAFDTYCGDEDIALTIIEEYAETGAPVVRA